MLRALHVRRGETVPELYSPHSRYREYGVGNERLDRIEERLSQSDRNAVYTAFDHSAHRVPLPQGGVQHVVPDLLVTQASVIGPAGEGFGPAYTANADHGCVWAYSEHLLGDSAGRDYREGDSSGEMASASRVIEVVPFDGRASVGVSGAGDVPEEAVVARAGVGVSENDGQRRSGSMSFEHSAEYLRLVRLYPRGGAFLSALPAEYVRHEIFFAQRYAGSHTVHHHAYGIAVGLSEYGDPELSSECVHRANLLNVSIKSGNDLATQAVSSMFTGPSAPREATIRAITILWSWLEV